ncbi:rhomboid family intramembrane serine protease [Cerasibacillus quisquiliarum]|uniref:rhomboid family intramembrane serine protease n=1 Tax=Cerasibacillus quisquiliarum TaxID=227865 RepID=UPI002482DEF3|nr:rhomboid family intramembrane serine protease [Cerasibacillus quisquiliarum]
MSGSVLFYFFYEGQMPISGSSGPIFGFIGILTFLAVRYFDRISANDKRFTVMMLLIGCVSTFLIPSVVISVNLGGFFGGILVAFIDSLFKEEKVQTTE